MMSEVGIIEIAGCNMVISSFDTIRFIVLYVVETGLIISTA